MCMRLFCSSSGFEILRQSSLLALPPFWAALLGAAQDCFMFQLHLQPAVSCRALSKWENKPGAAGVPYMAVWGQVAPGMPLPPPIPCSWHMKASSVVSPSSHALTHQAYGTALRASQWVFYFACSLTTLHMGFSGTAAKIRGRAAQLYGAASWTYK